MSQDRWAELTRVFAAARELEGHERLAFVDRACQGDEGLKRDVFELLEAEASSRAFLGEPALEQLARTVAAEGWNLRPGDQLGIYTIVERLGVGGAGEVWRARDDRLNRDVAIKVLLPHDAEDPERVQRFSDEARAAGTLNHASILAVYDVGDHHGVPYIVSECLDGQSLRQRLRTRGVPIGEALSIASKLAQGLVAAHARGIVHRDLKPENTFLRSDGGVKILDFGLATLQPSTSSRQTDDLHTATAVVAGTAGYMAPEQVRNGSIDGRADLFALGVMLYEMLTGTHPFRAASTFETLHAVLNVEPTDASTVNERVPPIVNAIVTRLLNKVPEQRFQTASDLVWALDHAVEAQPGRQTSDSKVPVTVAWRSQAAWAAAIIAVVAGGTAVLWPRRGPLEPTTVLAQFTWSLPADTTLASAPVVAPDGQHVAFTARRSARSQLYVRKLGDTEATIVPGTEGASNPFWSPDSRSLGYFARGRLITLAWPGGTPTPIADAAVPMGGAWGQSGRIVYGHDVILSGLRQIGPTGADHSATLLETAHGDNSHAWPSFLPDGQHFLYFVRSTDDARRGVYLGRADREPNAGSSPLWHTDSNAVYVPRGDAEGDLVSVVDGVVSARRFNLDRMTLDGNGRTLKLPSSGATATFPAMVSAAPTVLAYARGQVPYGARLEVVERDGTRVSITESAEPQNWPRVSPDGRWLARQRVDLLRNNPDIWVDDLERRTTVRLTTALEPDIQPVWSRDGRHLAYVTGNLPRRPGTRILSVAAADGSGVERSFACPGDYCEPTDWSADGSRLLVNVISARGADVWSVPVDGRGAARALLEESYTERDARWSPDARWLAYVSEESGRPEVSVRRLDGPRVRHVISAAGGDQPVWRRDGGELLFADPQGQLQSVSVGWAQPGPAPTFGAPRALNVHVGFGHWGTQFDIAPDGSRIYLMRPTDDPPPREIHIVLGWRELLR